eukprot:scaffold97793_cov67-Phaeocystis_antarctica.AAC.2
MRMCEAAEYVDASGQNVVGKISGDTSNACSPVDEIGPALQVRLGVAQHRVQQEPTRSTRGVVGTVKGVAAIHGVAAIRVAGLPGLEPFHEDANDACDRRHRPRIFPERSTVLPGHVRDDCNKVECE